MITNTTGFEFVCGGGVKRTCVRLTFVQISIAIFLAKQQLVQLSSWTDKVLFQT